MLRITQQDNADAAKKYYSTADYYTEGQEIVGNWGGKGADLLGLKGEVDKESFDRLCDNLDPRDQSQLTVRTRSKRRVGYDFTWSVPKSLSVLYGLTNDEMIAKAVREAVEATMRDMEAEMKARVRKDGKQEDRDTGNMIWSEFIHTTSRPVDGIPDPQLHVHAFVFNATYDQQEKRWKAGQFAGLKRDAPYFEALFRLRLAEKLQDQGFGIERTKDAFEITGVPKAILKRFSRRTQLIEKTAAERGITDPALKAELGAETRERKNDQLSWKQLRQEWFKRLSKEERSVLASVYHRVKPAVILRGRENEAVDYALDHCFTREAVVPERKLLTEAMKRGVGTASAAAIKKEIGKRSLIVSMIDGRRMATTRDMLSNEQKIIEFAKKGRGKYQPVAETDRPLVRAWLNDGQKAAVKHVLGSRDRVTLVRGVAGTGKTKMEEELRDAFLEAGIPVVALAQSAAASRGVLRDEAGFAQADTVARFLKDKGMQEGVRGGVVLVDEASLLGTKETLHLFEAAQRLEARVVLVGDRRQHRSVSAGEPLRLLEENAGLPVAELTEIIRQDGDYRKAAKALSEGNIEAGFKELDRLGWIREVLGDERNQALAKAYLAAAEKKRNGENKTALVVSPTHAEAEAITFSIRSTLKAQDKLGEERSFATLKAKHLTDAEKTDLLNFEPGDTLQFHQNAKGHPNGSRWVMGEGASPPVQFADRFEVYHSETVQLAVGDRVRVTAGGKTKDGKHRLDNGALFSVTGFTKGGDLVVDQGWVIAKDFGHLAHGYVVTSHDSQGKTVDKVFIGQSAQSFAASNQKQFYVSATRGREKVEIFTDDKRALLQAVSRPDETMSATELARSRKRRPLLARLRKQVAFLRGLGNFAQTHDTHLNEPMRQRSLTQESSHAR